MSASDVVPPEPADETRPVTAAAGSDDVPSRRRGWFVRAWPYLVVIFVCLAGSALHVARYTVLSPYDESRHVDYMARLFEDREVVRLGDRLGDTAMRLEACRGTDITGFVAPKCGKAEYDPFKFRDDGYNNAVNNPPVYYLTTGAVASAVKGLGITDTILDPARLMGGVWLAAGLALAVFAGELLGVRRVPLVAAAIVVALAPDVLFMASTVNADSPAVFAGALVLVVAILWERRRLGPVWLAVVGGLAASFKMTNLIAVGIVALWLLTEAWRMHRAVVPTRVGAGDAPAATDRSEDPPAAPATGGAAHRSPREILWGVALLVGAALLVTVAWIGIAGARATVDALDLPSNAQFYEPGFPFRSFFMEQNVFSLFPPFGDYRPPVLRTSMNQTVAIGTALLGGAVLIAAALRFSAKDRLVALSAWCGGLLLVAGPGFMASTWFVNKVIFEPASRYALSASGIVVVAIAAATRGRVGTILLSAFALVSIGTVLGTLAVG